MLCLYIEMYISRWGWLPDLFYLCICFLVDEGKKVHSIRDNILINMNYKLMLYSKSLLLFCLSWLELCTISISYFFSSLESKYHYVLRSLLFLCAEYSFPIVHHLYNVAKDYLPTYLSIFPGCIFGSILLYLHIYDHVLHLD